MQITLATFLRNTPGGEEAQGIVQKCVHCDFCTATYPTYQLLGDEPDSPRGHIYLMKQVLEGQPAGAATRLHLNRCLTCRNCESTCPFGVTYGCLVEIGRKIVDDQLDAKGESRPLGERAVRWALREGLTRPVLFDSALRLRQVVQSMLPPVLRNKVPVRQPHAGMRPGTAHARKMLLLESCVQPTMSSNISAAMARVFDKLDVQLISADRAGCCGVIRYHMNDHVGGLGNTCANIDAQWPHIEAGAEAIVMTASGCGAMVKEYGYLLCDDPAYAERVARVSAMTCDLCEVLPAFSQQLLWKTRPEAQRPRVAWHPPCTPQHGQQVRGVVEALFASLGVDVKLCADSHLCCGPVGTYSVLQPELAYRLRDDKLAKLQATQPERIVSANIGCLTHLQSGTDAPVEYWIGLVDRMLA